MQIVIDKKNCESYKTFYEIIYKVFDGKHMIDWEENENLCYSADMLDEFLWYVSEENTEFVMINFDIAKIKEQKTYDNYEWNIILKVLDRFVHDYPDNKLTFVKEEKQKTSNGKGYVAPLPFFLY